MIISKRIKELRIENNITQEELANAISRKKTTISNYENGTSIPDLKTAKSLAKYLHCSIDYLVGLSDYRFRDSQKSKINSEYQILNAYKVSKGKICSEDPAIMYVSENDIKDMPSPYVLIDDENIYLVSQKLPYIDGNNVVILQDKIYTGKLLKEEDNMFCCLYNGEKIKIKDTHIKGILIKTF